MGKIQKQNDSPANNNNVKKLSKVTKAKETKEKKTKNIKKLNEEPQQPQQPVEKVQDSVPTPIVELPVIDGLPVVENIKEKHLKKKKSSTGARQSSTSSILKVKRNLFKNLQSYNPQQEAIDALNQILDNLSMAKKSIEQKNENVAPETVVPMQASNNEK